MNTVSLENGDHERRLDESLLRSLHALLAEASVSQAAAKLGVAQSALSRHLKVLRQLTGDELLIRVGNRMVLTERAQALAAPTRRILADMSLLTSEAKPVEPGELRQSFRIATYDFLPRRFFADLVERVARQRPSATWSSAAWVRGSSTTASSRTARSTWSSPSGPRYRATCARQAC